MARREKHKVCPTCLIDRVASLFRDDPGTRSGLAAQCMDCQDGKPVPPGLEQRRKNRLRKFAGRRKAIKLRGAGVVRARPPASLSIAAARGQEAYCAFLYESARERLRAGKISDRSPEYRDALKSMEFLAREGVVRANGFVYRWDAVEERLDRRRDVGLIADARGRTTGESGPRVFREPRFQPERGVPMRPLAI